MTTGTLYAAQQGIPDRRTKKGRSYPLAAILVIAIAAMLSGANDLMAIFHRGRRLSPKALQTLAHRICANFKKMAITNLKTTRYRN